MTTTGTSNEAAVAGAIERWNAGDLDGYLELYADDVRLHGYTPEPMDKPAVRAFYEAFFAAFPGIQIKVDEMFGADERVSCRFTLSGRHDGPFMGVPATGSSITLTGITVMHVRDGRCVERWSCADMLGLLIQIGAVPPPPA
jgi:steroid delta-isomerase-like uncharacterized protein